MNNSEFNHWWSDYQDRFPSTARWVQNLPDPKATLASWLETLSATDLDDALAVNQAMSTGQLETLGTYDSDREATARAVRRNANDRKRAGIKNRPVSRAGHACELCRDTGWVSVWSRYSEAACKDVVYSIEGCLSKDTGFATDRRLHRSMAVACSCHLGERPIVSPKYSADKYCIVRDPTFGPDEVARFMAWVRKEESATNTEAGSGNVQTDILF